METDELYTESTGKMNDLMGDNPYEALAQRIAGLRDACGYEQEEFAQKLGIDSAVYAGYETNGYGVPAGMLIDMARICGVDVTEILTGSSARLDTFQVVRAGSGQPLDRYEGYTIVDLAYRFTGKMMQPLLVTLDPRESPADLVMHQGQEFNYCLQGQVEVVVGSQSVVLEPGDSIYFNPQLPHGQKCAGTTPATFISVVNE